MWGNFTIKDVLSLSLTGGVRHSIFRISEVSDFTSVLNFLKKIPSGSPVVLGRAGNITILDWKSISGDVLHHACIVKVQVGKVLSDLYVIRVKEVLRAFNYIEPKLGGDYRRFVEFLFDDYLFHNFESVVRVTGFSYLLRNSMEYFYENLNFAGHFNDETFWSVFRYLKTEHVSRTTVGEHGFVRNSFIGAGARIEGVVQNSTIFHDVVVGRGAIVRNSVILPSNIIEEQVTISNALILGGVSRTIGRNSVVGGNSNVKNAMFSSVLKKGLTVIGENVNVPPESRIGTGCLITGEGSGRSEPILLRDGETCIL
ncbi:MAG: hypothetical protein ACUVWJ_00785 [Spirochaetota bacterium]